MRKFPALALAALVALPALAAQAQQPFPQCGAVSLIFMNPDLRPRDDGYVHASGTFFIQFQAIGDRAAEVAKIGFSFGKPLPDALATCEPPAPLPPLTGVYIPQYRSDATPEDGFFVPINTTLVPDDIYGAALDAYTADGAVLAHLYTQAVVENGANCFPTADRCADHTAPWPIVLPGDGAQTNPVGGITIEFAEGVSDVLVRINGEQVVPEPWTPPARDDDAQPDNDDADCSALQGITDQTPLGNNYVCHRTIWGSGFHLAREAKAGDVIEVRALDQAGNEATKVLTIGGATQGGAIALQEPELQMTVDAVEQEVEAGQAAQWRLKLINVGQGDAEARMTVQAPDNVSVEWDAPTVTVAAGQEQVVVLKATPARDVKPGSYSVVAKATYKSGTDDKEQQLPLKLGVREYRPVPESPLRQTRVNTTDNEPPPENARATPGLEPAFAAGAVAAVALLVARRARRD
jgi:hypothetical protein